MSPPRLVWCKATPFCHSTASLARRCCCLPLRPRVMVGGCSQSSRTSPIAPALRAATTRSCNAYASAQSIRPRLIRAQEFIFAPCFVHLRTRGPEAVARMIGGSWCFVGAFYRCVLLGDERQLKR